MGLLLKVVGRTAKKGAQAITAKKSECVGCGKELRSARSNVCSTKCAHFVGESY